MAAMPPDHFMHIVLKTEVWMQFDRAIRAVALVGMRGG
jgi:hypothetical protein